jgi:hypothetical protein
MPALRCLVPLWLGWISLGAAAAATPPAGPSGWLGNAQREIATREYHASRNARGLQAPNRAQNLRSYFDGTGVRVHDRTGAGEPELVALSLARIGRAGALAAAAPGAVVHERERVEIRRPGLVEWYVNGPDGLEQGFTLDAAPPGEGPLVLELSVAAAGLAVRERNASLTSSTGRRLSFAKLAAFDAARRTLPSRFEQAGEGRLRLVVDDRGARYPLVVDPLLSASEDTLLASPLPQTGFGNSVASGDVNGDGYADLIVGAPFYDDGGLVGAVFVFHGAASGIADGGPADADAQLVGDQAGSNFGGSVRIAGDVNGDGFADLIVGAPEYDAGQDAEGAAFVFHGSAAGLVGTGPASAATQLESDQAFAGLGYSVSGAGDVNGDGFADVIVGARFLDAGETNEGGAFLFLGSSSGIADGTPASAATRLEGNQTSARFGVSVAGAGDLDADGYSDVIVGASSYEAGEVGEGAAFIFHGSPSGIPHGGPATAETRIEANQDEAKLGSGVAAAGDVNGDGYADVLVGAAEYENDQTEEGAVFVFHGSATGIADGSPATADSRIESDQPFGAELGVRLSGIGDLNGDGYADIALGMRHYEAPPATGSSDGAVMVLFGGADGIPDASPATADFLLEGLEDSLYGADVASQGDVNGDGYADLVVGSGTAIVTGGVVHVYHGGGFGVPSDVPTAAAAHIDSDQANTNLGWSVAGAGDVNGDGFSDVIVGAYAYDAGETNEGAAFVFHGGPAGIVAGDPGDAAAQLEANQANAGLGFSVAGAGDVNGDGYGDVIVGAWLYDAGESNEGAAFVFHGSSSGVVDGNPATAPTQLESNQASGVLGWSVAGAGDVNGDGLADVILGAPLLGSGGTALVFHGRLIGIADGNPSTAKTVLLGVSGASFGWDVAGAGDVNGDGFADVIVGADTYSNGQSFEGAAFVFHGGAAGIASGTAAGAATQLESNQTSANLGYSVAGAGDVNGDGFADVIVGARGYDSGATDDGIALVFHGGAAGVADGDPAAAATYLEGDAEGIGFGGDVGGAGDVNGDGYADVIVGASGYDENGTDEGAAFVFHGGPSGVADANAGAAATALVGDDDFGQLGASVAGAGDVNGDGFADVIAGAYARLDQGAAFVYLGGGGPGRLLKPIQARASNSALLQPGARAESTLRLRATASHPEGRGRVRLQVEHCPPGVAFGAPSCTVGAPGSWTALPFGSAAVVVTRDVAGLPSNTLRRWRARVQYAPLTGAVPVAPAHGPWRRLQAQAFEADVRSAAPPPSTGCGMGPELLLLAPVLWGLRGRLRGR